MEVFKNIMLVLLGIVLAVGIFCVSVGIGCAVNGLTFGEQICEWFGSNAETIEEATEDIVEAFASLPIA